MNRINKSQNFCPGLYFNAWLKYNESSLRRKEAAFSMKSINLRAQSYNTDLIQKPRTKAVQGFIMYLFSFYRFFVPVGRGPVRWRLPDCPEDGRFFFCTGRAVALRSTGLPGEAEPEGFLLGGLPDGRFC